METPAQQPPARSQNGDTLTPLAGSGRLDPLGALRCAPLLRLASSGWTRPLWQDVGQSSAALLDPNQFWREVLAWMFCDSQKRVEQLIKEQRRNHSEEREPEFYGPLTWLSVWEQHNQDFVNGLSEREIGQVMLFFTEEFYPRTDYWRNRVGFDRMLNSAGEPDLWAGLEVDIPSAQLQPTIARLRHGPDMYECRVGWADSSDTSDLIRFQWCRRLWAWEKGLAGVAPAEL
jgi:hypothetical protein